MARRWLLWPNFRFLQCRQSVAGRQCHRAGRSAPANPATLSYAAVNFLVLLQRSSPRDDDDHRDEAAQWRAATRSSLAAAQLASERPSPWCGDPAWAGVHDPSGAIQCRRSLSTGLLNLGLDRRRQSRGKYTDDTATAMNNVSAMDGWHIPSPTAETGVLQQVRDGIQHHRTCRPTPSHQVCVYVGAFASKTA